MTGNENDKNTSERAEPEKPWPIERFLKRIAAIVIIFVSIAGGITAIVNYISSTKYMVTQPKVTTQPSSPGSGFPLTEDQPLAARQTPEKCFVAKHLKPNLLPHYLLPSMGGSENFPYWLKFVGKNNCDKQLRLTVQFQPKTGMIWDASGGLEPLKIESRENFEVVVEPDDIRLTSTDISYVKINYTVEEVDTETMIDWGQIEARIVPPYTVAWDLQKPSASDGKFEPVDRAYLVKSLAAWTFRPPKLVAKRARECRSPTGSGRKLIKEEALCSCYDNLFRDDQNSKISVHDSPIKLPAGKLQKILPPWVVIQEKSATSLEAALLFAAVMNKERRDGIDPKLVMLAAPQENNSLNKNVYIAWREPGNAWKAIDLRKANQKSFDENVATSSKKVNDVFTTEIESAIEARGAFFSSDETLAVLDFKKVEDEREIFALPKN